MNNKFKAVAWSGCCAPNFISEPIRHDATRRKNREVQLYPKPVDFRKSIDGLAALGIKFAVFDPVLFFLLNRPRNRMKFLYCERNVFCL
ncbi:MAG: IS66 family insertion sequence element accessory protein TnpB [Pseudomonas capeferrum]|uniref:IS66 family insertion sequence element accessory protein TnpB n=1 Tax=Pseudomonas TaxID=286 RepID=UPI003D0A766D